MRSLGASGADFGALRAGWDRGSLWPGLLMKGRRKVKPWRVWG